MKLNKKIILASSSPRRKEILTDAGFQFEIEVHPIDENRLPPLSPEEVAEFLATEKVAQFVHRGGEYIVIAADTVVILDNQILNKPQNEKEASEMLKLLSGRKHTVITGVGIKIGEEISSFSDRTDVWFKDLSEEEIGYYIKNYSPLDKAGSYGIQDFLGMVGISRLEGSFYTVMGFPIHVVYDYLKPYIEL